MEKVIVFERHPFQNFPKRLFFTRSELIERAEVPPGKNMDLIGPAGVERNERRKGRVLSNHATPVAPLLLHYFAEQAPPPRPGVSARGGQLSFQPRGNERQGVDLAVGLRHRDANHGLFVFAYTNVW